MYLETYKLGVFLVQVLQDFVAADVEHRSDGHHGEQVSNSSRLKVKAFSIKRHYRQLRQGGSF